MFKILTDHYFQLIIIQALISDLIFSTAGNNLLDT
jgi:hypothetical protein